MSVIREAVQRLQTLRVIVTHQGRPSSVENVRWKHLSIDPSLGILALEQTMLREIWEARYGIEKETARLAAIRATAADIAEMQTIIDGADSEELGFDEHQALNSAFHMALARASKNEVLVDTLEPLLAVNFGSMRRIFSVEVCELAWKTHCAIFAAVAAHDIELAAKAMAAHADAFAHDLAQMTEVLDGKSPARRQKKKRN